MLLDVLLPLIGIGDRKFTNVSSITAIGNSIVITYHHAWNYIIDSRMMFEKPCSNLDEGVKTGRTQNPAGY